MSKTSADWYRNNRAKVKIQRSTPEFLMKKALYQKEYRKKNKAKLKEGAKKYYPKNLNECSIKEFREAQRKVFKYTTQEIQQLTVEKAIGAINEMIIDRKITFVV